MRSLGDHDDAVVDEPVEQRDGRSYLLCRAVLISQQPSDADFMARASYETAARRTGVAAQAAAGPDFELNMGRHLGPTDTDAGEAGT